MKGVNNTNNIPFILWKEMYCGDNTHTNGFKNRISTIKLLFSLKYKLNYYIINEALQK